MVFLLMHLTPLLYHESNFREDTAISKKSKRDPHVDENPLGDLADGNFDDGPGKSDQLREDCDE